MASVDSEEQGPLDPGNATNWHIWPLSFCLFLVSSRAASEPYWFLMKGLSCPTAKMIFLASPYSLGITSPSFFFFPGQSSHCDLQGEIYPWCLEEVKSRIALPLFPMGCGIFPLSRNIFLSDHNLGLAHPSICCTSEASETKVRGRKSCSLNYSSPVSRSHCGMGYILHRPQGDSAELLFFDGWLRIFLSHFCLNVLQPYNKVFYIHHKFFKNCFKQLYWDVMDAP
jgi:hypothetical protein